MNHDWVFKTNQDTDDVYHRKCKNCLIEEFWDVDNEKWLWLSTEDFMDCPVSCQDWD